MDTSYNRDELLTADQKSETPQEFSLIEGTFSAGEAQEILMSLIGKKLSFHSKKNLRSFEHSGQEDPATEERIQELEQIREEVLEFLQGAKKEDVSLEIQSKVQIKLVNNQGEDD